MKYFFAVFLVFLIMKLLGIIDWHWAWVLSPCWIHPIVLVGSIAFLRWAHNYQMRNDPHYALRHTLDQIKKGLK